jgi:hypothetical protein
LVPIPVAVVVCTAPFPKLHTVVILDVPDTVLDDELKLVKFTLNGA